MMEYLALDNGSLVNLFNVTLPKGQYVKLQPHLTKFTQLSNPKIVYALALSFVVAHCGVAGWRRRCATLRL